MKTFLYSMVCISALLFLLLSISVYLTLPVKYVSVSTGKCNLFLYKNTKIDCSANFEKYHIEYQE